MMEKDERGDSHEEVDEEYQCLVVPVAIKGTTRPSTFQLNDTARFGHSKIACGYGLLFFLLLVVQQNLKFVSHVTARTSSTAAEAHHSYYETAHRWPPMQMLSNLFNGSRDVDDSQPKRLVVVATNAAYVYFADNFASSLLRLNVTNFVIVPLDENAFRLLQPAYPLQTLPPPPSTDDSSAVMQKAAVYGSNAFRTLTSSRPTFLRHFIEQNITVFYNDVDMVWHRNAWSALDQIDPAGTRVKIWEDGDSQLCSCLLYLPTTDVTLQFLREWEREIRSQRHNNDQPALGAAAVTLGIDRLWRRYNNNNEDSHHDDEVQILPHSDEFPTGRDYFQLGSNRSRAVIIHNNWITGQWDKRSRFQNNGLWNLSGRLTPEKLAPPASPMSARVFHNWTTTVRRNTDPNKNKVKNKTLETGN